MPNGAKNWTFTAFYDPSTVSPDSLLHKIRDAADYLIYGVEICPTTARTHAQGYCQFNTRRALAFVKRLAPQAHWEVARGTPEQNMEYCKKDGNYFQHGTPNQTSQGSRSDLKRLKNSIDGGASLQTIARDFFPDYVRYHRGIEKYYLLQRPKERNWKTTLHIYWGEAGTGKSKYALEHNPEAFWMMKPQGHVWMDGYDAHETVIMDDFTSSWMPYNLLIRMSDRYPLNMEIKGGAVPFLAKKIIITSNYHWTNWYDWDKCFKPALERRIDEIKQFI